jgi:hypothetical protein
MMLAFSPGACAVHRLHRLMPAKSGPIARYKG